MAETTVSSKYQVVIPKEVRQRLQIKPGQKLSVIAKGGIVYLVPVLELDQLQGFVRGIDTSNLREKADRF